MPQLAFGSGFWEKFDQMEKPVRAGVRKAMKKFQELTVPELQADKGLHLESVENARDPRMRTIRVTDYWRGVVLAPDDGSQTFTLVSVVPHDEAYDWAAKRLYTVNSATRGLEVRNVVAIEHLTPLLAEAAAQEPSRLFGAYSDTDLRHLGVDDGILPAVRTITDGAQLDALTNLFPEDQFEVLWFLAQGHTTEEVWRDVVATRRPANADTQADTLDNAIANTPTRFSLVSGPQELEEILSKSFAAWRIYLHPSQRRIAYQPSYDGSVQVTGGPGTGKTVVALHRVKHLLTRNPDSRILLTTYTVALAASLRENLASLLDDPSLLARVEVNTVNSVAAEAVRKLRGGKAPGRVDDAAERAQWEQLRRQFKLAWTSAFLAQEFRHVVLGQDLRTLEAYLACDRRGRGSGLGPKQRAEVWQAVQAFTSGLAKSGRQTHLQLCAEAARLLNAMPGAGPRYDHVVVDEAQDLHPAQWRVLRALVPDGADDLFITGDPHQRIYDSRVSLRSLGIRVAGRTGRLRINYRSTEEILLWSKRVLEGARVEELGGEGSDSLAGYRSLLHGTRPAATGFGEEREEVAALVEQVQEWLAAGASPSEIGVCARFNTLLDKVEQRLDGAGLPVVRVKEGMTTADEGIRLSTMHSMKGLEYRCVAVVGATVGAFPFAVAVTPAAVDRLQHEADLMAERCLLFVACTRARESLYVSYSGEPSPFIGG